MRTKEEYIEIAEMYALKAVSAESDEPLDDITNAQLATAYATMALSAESRSR